LLLRKGDPVLNALATRRSKNTPATLSLECAVTNEMRTESDLPVLPVIPDDGYNPSLEATVAFVTTDAPTPPDPALQTPTSHT